MRRPQTIIPCNIYKNKNKVNLKIYKIIKITQWTILYYYYYNVLKHTTYYIIGILNILLISNMII